MTTLVQPLNEGRLESVMKDNIVRSVLLACLLVLGAASKAQTTDPNCYAIQDKDLRNLCVALTSAAPQNCYAITHSNTRAFCLAIVRQNKTECYAIDTSDYRSLCLALA